MELNIILKEQCRHLQFLCRMVTDLLKKQQLMQEEALMMPRKLLDGEIMILINLNLLNSN